MDKKEFKKLIGEAKYAKVSARVAALRKARKSPRQIVEALESEFPEMTSILIWSSSIGRF